MAEVIRIGGLELEFLQDKQATEGSLDMFRMVVQPKARVPAPHYHESWDETVYGLDGLLMFRIDGRDVPIAPGDTAFIKRGVTHWFTNNSEAPATCLCVLTPGILGPGYFRELAALLAGGPPDPARVAEVMARYGLVVA